MRTEADPGRWCGRSRPRASLSEPPAARLLFLTVQGFERSLWSPISGGPVHSSPIDSGVEVSVETDTATPGVRTGDGEDGNSWPQLHAARQLAIRKTAPVDLDMLVESQNRDVPTRRLSMRNAALRYRYAQE